MVQGRLRDESLSFDVESECACCERPIRFSIESDLEFSSSDPSCQPLFFVPIVDFTRLQARSIIDRF